MVLSGCHRPWPGPGGAGQVQRQGQMGAAGSHTAFLKDMLIPASLDR